MSAFIHEAALVESDSVGARTRVWAFAHIMEGAVVGEDCNVCDGAFVESGAVVGNRVTVKNNALVWDGVVLGDDVFVGPNVVFTNDPNPRVTHKKSPSQFVKTIVEDGASIGANATIVCGVTIRRGAFVGAGSVVTADVAAHALVLGNPARQAGWMCSCGGRVGDDLLCVECRISYQEDGRGGLESV